MRHKAKLHLAGPTGSPRCQSGLKNPIVELDPAECQRHAAHPQPFVCESCVRLWRQDQDRAALTPEDQARLARRLERKRAGFQDYRERCDRFVAWATRQAATAPDGTVLPRARLPDGTLLPSRRRRLATTVEGARLLGIVPDRQKLPVPRFCPTDKTPSDTSGVSATPQPNLPDQRLHVEQATAQDQPGASPNPEAQGAGAPPDPRCHRGAPEAFGSGSDVGALDKSPPRPRDGAPTSPPTVAAAPPGPARPGQPPPDRPAVLASTAGAEAWAYRAQAMRESERRGWLTRRDRGQWTPERRAAATERLRKAMQARAAKGLRWMRAGERRSQPIAAPNAEQIAELLGLANVTALRVWLGWQVCRLLHLAEGGARGSLVSVRAVERRLAAIPLDLVARMADAVCWPAGRREQLLGAIGRLRRHTPWLAERRPRRWRGYSVGVLARWPVPGGDPLVCGRCAGALAGLAGHDPRYWGEQEEARARADAAAAEELRLAAAALAAQRPDEPEPG